MSTGKNLKKATKKQLKEILSRHYPVSIYWLEQDKCYFGFLPDFGASACSYTGDTREEVLSGLDKVFKDVVVFCLESGREIPVPSKDPTEPAPKDLKTIPVELKTTHAEHIEWGFKAGEGLCTEDRTKYVCGHLFSVDEIERLLHDAKAAARLLALNTGKTTWVTDDFVSSLVDVVLLPISGHKAFNWTFTGMKADAPNEWKRMKKRMKANVMGVLQLLWERNTRKDADEE